MLEERIIKSETIGKITLELVQENDLFVFYWKECGERLTSDAYTIESEAMETFMSELNYLKNKG